MPDGAQASGVQVSRATRVRRAVGWFALLLALMQVALLVLSMWLLAQAFVRVGQRVFVLHMDAGEFLVESWMQAPQSQGAVAADPKTSYFFKIRDRKKLLWWPAFTAQRGWLPSSWSVRIAHWPVVAACALAAWWLLRSKHLPISPKIEVCSKCGYLLSGVPLGVVCPECGTQRPLDPSQVHKKHVPWRGYRPIYQGTFRAFLVNGEAAFRDLESEPYAHPAARAIVEAVMVIDASVDVARSRVILFDANYDVYVGETNPSRPTELIVEVVATHNRYVSTSHYPPSLSIGALATNEADPRRRYHTASEIRVTHPEQLSDPEWLCGAIRGRYSDLRA